MIGVIKSWPANIQEEVRWNFQTERDTESEDESWGGGDTRGERGEAGHARRKVKAMSQVAGHRLIEMD